MKRLNKSNRRTEQSMESYEACGACFCGICICDCSVSNDPFSYTRMRTNNRIFASNHMALSYTNISAVIPDPGLCFF